MAQILKVNGNEVQIGTDDHQIITVPIATLAFSNPKVGDEVEVFKNKTETIVNRLGAKKTASNDTSAEGEKGVSYTLRLIAFILNIITMVGLVFTIFGIIGLAWMIPMTICLYENMKDSKRHIALSVCTLIFVNLISGVLMLVSDFQNPEEA